MKKGLIVCGTGVATSTVVLGKVKEYLTKEDLISQVELHQANINDAHSRSDDYVFIVSTTIVPDDWKENVIDGVPLLTGIGEEEVYLEIRNKLV
ncbi:PTS sugar transporter subunit IIB [Virgibacillus halodenitrificans]|uniref:PTS galactitol transporter subunit IIB n=1 Tax=Virgibacillus halodenitrificans TaxID=1482 RepID=A0AAC9NLU5_VIRHA|nr:PTS sugar transporter subunit IIB [Virgibacillus halodenitrificans]APC49435.1 PTS galactitol transporter subunit IIB [Virgibacillus halodenitrificans]MEC2159547.1 PTS sugar transporter subunit IIB [Virgibacillus halodenitrificans]MYL60851.1 PTS galactitol transporter subunit IIB [Virgibacillus halodenitrificans]